LAVGFYDKDSKELLAAAPTRFRRRRHVHHDAAVPGESPRAFVLVTVRKIPAQR
jgi:hypothetical protein